MDLFVRFRTWLLGPGDVPVQHRANAAGAAMVVDDYTLDRIAVDQLGAGEVLSFDLGGPAALVFVDVDALDPNDPLTYLCRATVDGSAPTSSRGWRCRSGQATAIPVPCTAGIVKVYAPTGVSVSVQAGAR